MFGVCCYSRLSSRHFPNLCKRQQRKSRLQPPWRALSLGRGKDLRIEMVELFSWTYSSSPCNLTRQVVSTGPILYSRLACSTDRTRLSSGENLSPNRYFICCCCFRQENFNRSSFREFPLLGNRLRGLAGNSHGPHAKLVQFENSKFEKQNIT